MPNYCANLLTLTGDKDERIRFKELASGESPLDISNFLPQPEELEGTISPKPGDADFDPERDADLKARFGASDWWNWRMDNWGTKWGTFDSLVEVDSEQVLSYQYMTAWSPVLITAWQEISRELPLPAVPRSVRGAEYAVLGQAMSRRATA